MEDNEVLLSIIHVDERLLHTNEGISQPVQHSVTSSGPGTSESRNSCFHLHSENLKTREAMNPTVRSRSESKMLVVHSFVVQSNVWDVVVWRMSRSSSETKHLVPPLRP